MANKITKNIKLINPKYNDLDIILLWSFKKIFSFIPLLSFNDKELFKVKFIPKSNNPTITMVIIQTLIIA